MIKKQRNARALLAEVKDLDLENKVVQAPGPDGRAVDLPYDTLVVAAGATHSYFGKDEFAEFAPGMKTIEDARYLRDGILSKFEMAELATDPQERAEWLTFVVIGAGPTGVELAGQIAELAHKVLPQDYRSVDTREARIILLEGAPSVLPPFKPKLQKLHPASSWRRWASRSGSTPWPSTWTTSRSPSRARTAWRPSAPAPGSGPPACRPRRWPRCSPRRPARRPTGPAGSR